MSSNAAPRSATAAVACHLLQNGIPVIPNGVNNGPRFLDTLLHTALLPGLPTRVRSSMIAIPLASCHPKSDTNTHTHVQARTRRCIHRLTHRQTRPRTIHDPARMRTVAAHTHARFSRTGKPAVHGGTGVVSGSRGSAHQLHDGLDPFPAQSYTRHADKRRCNGARHICSGTALAGLPHQHRLVRSFRTLNDSCQRPECG